jgi:hypothetical protein
MEAYASTRENCAPAARSATHNRHGDVQWAVLGHAIQRWVVPEQLPSGYVLPWSVAWTLPSGARKWNQQ